MLQHIYCYTARIWFPCNVSWKLVAESGCKQIQSWLVMCITISWKTEISSFHSELCLAFRDSKSACTFKWTCWCARVLCWMYPVSASELLYLIVICWILVLQTLLLLVSEHLCADPATFLPISPKLTSFYNRLPKMMFMHLFVSLNLVPFILVIFHCLVLNFTPIKDVPVLADSLIVIVLLLL